MPGDETTTPEASDELPALLAAAGRGDESAWRRLIALYGRRVYAMVQSRVRNEHVAEEIAQSVFATVASKLSSGSYGERGRFESWLFRITMNRVRDEARRAKHRPVAASPETFEQSLPDSGERQGPDAAAMASLRGAMAELPDSDREVVELRHHAGMSFKHIADLLEQPLGTVLARHHRALKKLKDMLGGQASGTLGNSGGGAE
jgi:RNA polymerase sigma-70 factor (ECF subfamily)